MQELWIGLTEGQGAVLSTLITVVAAGLGFLIVWLLFNNRVVNLQKAIEETEHHVKGYSDRIDEMMKDFASNLKEFQSTTDESFKQVKNTVGDLQTVTLAAADPNASEENLRQREAIQQDWYVIRDHLEHLVSTDPDEAARLEYGKIDRRRGYPVLIEAMRDEILRGKRQQFLEAANIWNKYRTGRATPIREDVDRIDALRIELAPGER